LMTVACACAAGLAMAGCGTATYDASKLEQVIRTRLDLHRGYQVRSVSCPAKARLAKGVVINCTATLATGHVVRMRATQLDSKGTVHLVAGEMLPENVEHGIQVTLAQRGVQANARCPEHVPVVIGKQFACRVSYNAGRTGRAVVTIVDGDGG